MTANETRTIITDIIAIAEGDEVVLTKGTNVLRAKVVKYDGVRVLDIGRTRVGAPRLASFFDSGYTVEKITPKPPTPTAPGHYTDKNGKPWLLMGRRGTVMRVAAPWVAWDGGNFTPEYAERAYGPFTRVVPAPAAATEPAVVKDRDGDTWKRQLDGTYTSPGLTPKASLTALREVWGPLSFVEEGRA
jgi:hypothetical protein